MSAHRAVVEEAGMSLCYQLTSTSFGKAIAYAPDGRLVVVWCCKSHHGGTKYSRRHRGIVPRYNIFQPLSTIWGLQTECYMVKAEIFASIRLLLLLLAGLLVTINHHASYTELSYKQFANVFYLIQN